MLSGRSSYTVLRKVIILTVLISSLGLAQTPATGLHARATPADYAASQQVNGTTYAASLIPADQVRHLFAVDISKNYLVFEVACYPSATGAVTTNPASFLIKPGSQGEFVHPADASTIAGFIQDKNMPRPRSRETDITTAATIGYESGTDPYTGRPVHGVYTASEVGVANGRDNYPPPPPRPGSSPQERRALEDQLADKSLAEGTFTVPVAGFVYFPLDPLKKAKGNYDLQYLTDEPGKVNLLIQTKKK